jgi:hypothetical protein
LTAWDDSLWIVSIAMTDANKTPARILINTSQPADSSRVDQITPPLAGQRQAAGEPAGSAAIL